MKNKEENINKEYDFVRIKNLRQRPRSKKFVIEITSSESDLEEEYVIDEDVIIKYYVFKDKEYSVKEFKEILREMKLSSYFNKCINYLSYGPKSKHEIYKYLDKLNEDNTLKQSDLTLIVRRLEDLKYVDDYEYSNVMLNYYKNNKGPKYIEQVLFEKGVKSDIINLTIENYEVSDQIEVALKIANKYIDSIRKYPFRKQQLKISQKLMRDGFEMDVINKVINKLDFVDESDEQLIKDLNKQIKRLENKDLSDYEKKQRIIASLMNKGYNYKNIIDILKK